MFKYISSILLIVGFLSEENSSTDCSAAKLTSAQGVEYLKKVQDAYEKLSSFSADFSQQSYLDALETSENSSGKVFFKKSGKMLWHYKEPEEQVFTVKDNSLWLYQVSDKQVLVDKLGNVLLSELPVSFLMGLGNISKDFKINYACKYEGGYLFSLSPANSKEVEKQADLDGFRLAVDARFLPLKVVITDSVKNINTIVLKNYDLNAQVAESVFNTEYPSDVDVNDRRQDS